MEHKHPAPCRPDIAADPVSAPPVGPLIPGISADPDADDQAIALPEPEPYDPNEYRWVPVRRRPRHDGWTEEEQQSGKGKLCKDEFNDMCHHLDPAYRHDKGRKRYSNSVSGETLV